MFWVNLILYTKSVIIIVKPVGKEVLSAVSSILKEIKIVENTYKFKKSSF